MNKETKKVTTPTGGSMIVHAILYAVCEWWFLQLSVNFIYIYIVFRMCHAVWHNADGNGVISAQLTTFVSSELHRLLTNRLWAEITHCVLTQ